MFTNKVNNLNYMITNNCVIMLVETRMYLIRVLFIELQNALNKKDCKLNMFVKKLKKYTKVN